MAADGPPEALSAEAGIRAARALGDSRNYRGAVDGLRRVLAQDPENATAHYLLGIYLYNLGRKHDAREACEAALALAPEDAVAHRMLGIVLGARVRDRKRGLAHLRQAVALAPHDGFNHYFLAHALAGLARQRAALASFATACERAPQEPVVLAGTAGFLFSVGRQAEAKDLAARALAVAPDDHMAMAVQAKACLIDGRVRDARALALAAVSIHATYRPAIEVLIEADMCRNPLFALWSRVRNWGSGRKRRRALALIGLYYGLSFALGGLAAFIPALASAYPWLLAAFVVAAVLPSIVYARRLSAAVKPARLRKGF